MGKAKRLKARKKPRRHALPVVAYVPQRSQSKYSPRSGDRRR